MARSAAVLNAPPDIPSTHYVDNQIYTNERIFQLENERLHSKIWKCVAHVSEIAEPFDFRTVTVAGVPLIILRNKEGELKAFVNVCSHRGVQVETRPAGNAKSFQCKFHLWTYNTKGACVGMPRGEAYEPCGLSKKDLGLKEVRIGEVKGLVFVNLDDDAISLEEFVGDSLELVADIFDNQELEVFHYHEQILDTNWKNWQETNMELYHEYLHVLNRHTSLEKDAYFARKWHTYDHGHCGIEPYVVDYENYEGMKARSDLAFKGLQASEFRLVDLFPDLLVLCRSTVVRLDQQEPIAPGKTKVIYRALGVKGEPAADRRQRARDNAEFWGPFGRNLPEDMVVCEAQTKAMSEITGGYTIWAREEDNKTQDDVGIRNYFQEWSRLMDIDPANPEV